MTTDPSIAPNVMLKEMNSFNCVNEFIAGRRTKCKASRRVAGKVKTKKGVIQLSPLCRCCKERGS